MKRPQSITLILSAGALALAAVELSRRDWILYNATPSVPPGLYVRVHEPPRPGAFVTVRAADVAFEYAQARGFTDAGDRFIKRLASREGEQVCASGGTVSIGTETFPREREDSVGRLLPTWEGCRVLERGEVMLMGDTPDSFDSRYFGVVREDEIEGVWRRF